MLSPVSTRKIYELGIESIPSESECYPAKLAHGHISWLLKQGVKFIFYPCIPYERNEDPGAVNHYNCPIVTSYAENIKNNVDELNDPEIRFMNPFLALTSEKILADELVKVFPQIPEEEIRDACHSGWEEMAVMRKGYRSQGRGDSEMDGGDRTPGHCPGRPSLPYRPGDPPRHPGYDQFLRYCRAHRGLRVPPGLLWSGLCGSTTSGCYHTRLYAAANYVKTREDLDLIQLNSFGCGLDAVTTDQVYEILTGSGKIYTCLKIDEVNNLGAARIRVRSLLAALRAREKNPEKRDLHPSSIEKVVFTEEMRKDYTILCPQMSPIHFNILEPAFNSEGYHLEILGNDNKRRCGT